MRVTLNLRVSLPLFPKPRTLGTIGNHVNGYALSLAHKESAAKKCAAAGSRDPSLGRRVGAERHDMPTTPEAEA
jgi:hypothetical protein